MDAEGRFRKVERELRAWRLGVALLTGCALLSGAQPKKEPKTIEAERLIIKDEQGRRRIILDTVWPQGDAYMSVLDVRGKERLAVGVIDHGVPFLQMIDSHGKTRFVTELIDESAELRFQATDGKVVDRMPR